MTAKFLRVAACVVGLSLAAGAHAQAPRLLGYQGRLTRSDGTPESGVVSVTFRLFDQPVSGSLLWEETQLVALSDGYYSTFLGSTPDGGAALSPALFDGTARYLEVAFQGATLTPRQKVASVAYALVSTDALNAKNVTGGAVVASTITVAGRQVVDASGTLAETDPTVQPFAKAALPDAGCVATETLTWSGTTWSCTAIAAATTNDAGIVRLGTSPGTAAAGDDVRFGNATKLQGRTIATTAPTNGQVLAFNTTTSQFEPKLPFSSCHTVSANFSAGVALGTAEGTIACPAGETVVGGGGYCGGCHMLASRPEQNGWYLYCVGGCSGGGGNYPVYAICCR